MPRICPVCNDQHDSTETSRCICGYDFIDANELNDNTNLNIPAAEKESGLYVFMRGNFLKWLSSEVKDLKKSLRNALISLLDLLEFIIKALPILIGLVIVYFVWINPVLSDKPKSQIYFSVNGITFEESKYLLGSIYNKDNVIITNNHIEVIVNNIFGKKTIILPYQNISSVEASKIYGGYNFVIVYPGEMIFTNRFRMNFREKETIIALINEYKTNSKNRSIITENIE